jgi:hypothetical protein
MSRNLWKFSDGDIAHARDAGGIRGVEARAEHANEGPMIDQPTRSETKSANSIACVVTP